MSGGERENDYDVVVVGAGPAGSTLAYHLSAMGHKTLVVEKAEFPREHIGESLTGHCAVLLRDMGLEDVLGQQDFPIKHGVTVLGANGRTSFDVPVQNTNEFGELEPTTTWQVRRPEFDQLLLDAAKKQGAHVAQAEVRRPLQEEGRITGLTLKLPDGEAREVSCRVVADASGQSTFLSKHGIAGPRQANRYDKQIAFYGQLEGVTQDTAPHSGDTVIFHQDQHCWAWQIPISSTVTSVGVVLPAKVFKESQLRSEAFFDLQLKSLHPNLAKSLEKAKLVSPVWRMANYSYKIDGYTGPGFLCLGDAHRFLDPIFSFGVYVGMKEAVLAASAISDHLAQTTPAKADPFASFRMVTDDAQRIIQDLINLFWEYPLAFLRLAHFSHRNEIAELFAGRFYGQDSDSLEVVGLMRDLLARKGL